MDNQDQIYEIQKRVSEIKLNMVKHIHELTLKALATTDIDLLENVLKERGYAIAKFSNYQTKINSIQKEKNITLETLSSFKQQYNGYIKALAWNSQSLNRKLQKEKDKIAKQITNINNAQNIVKYLKVSPQVALR